MLDYIYLQMFERLSSIAVINLERPYANRILLELMDGIIDIFGKGKLWFFSFF